MTLSKTQQRIMIVGQGAIGLLWYHHLLCLSQKKSDKLADNKLDITLLASDQRQALNAPYQFISFQSKKHYQGQVNYAQPDDIAQAELIIFCLKSYQTCSAIKKLINKINKQAVIVLAHNGMGVFEQLPEQLSKQHNILAMLTTHGSLRKAPLSIEHTGVGTSDIGLLNHCDNKQSNSTVKTHIELLNAALPTVEFHHNILFKQWLKLAINCVINPITALNNIDNGDIVLSKYQQLVDDILNELILVAKAEGIEFCQHELKAKVLQVAKATAKNCSSMRSDVNAKRLTEIDYINGYIDGLGKKHIIATPVNSLLVEQVKLLNKYN